MLKRLFFAVFTLSLVLAVCATAFASTDQRGTVDEGVVKTVHHPVTDNPVKMSVHSQPDASYRPAAITQQGSDLPYPSPYGAEHTCEILDYSDYGANGVFYSFDMTGDDPDEHASRFDTQDLHYSSLVKGAALRIYDVSNVSGGVDLTINVREDAGTEPGAIIYSETFPAAGIIANGAGFWLFTFSTPVEIAAPTYYISFTSGGTGPVDDYITMGLNTTDAGGGAYADNGRGMDYYAADLAWYTTAEYWGQPMNNRIAADVCYGSYSNCYTQASGIQWVFGAGLPAVDFNGSGKTLTGISQRFTAGRDTLKTVSVALFIDGAPHYAGTNETNGLTVQVWNDDGSGGIDYASGPIATRVVPPGVSNFFPATNEDPMYAGYFEYLDVDFSADNIFFDGGGPFHVSAEMTSTDPAGGVILPLNMDYGNEGGSIDYDLSGSWVLTGNDADFVTYWYNPVEWTFQVELCPDEFPECDYQFLYDQVAGGTNTGIPLGDSTAWNPGGAAQLVKGPAGPADNRVERVRFQVLDETPFGGAVGDNGNPQIKVVVWTAGTDDYGYPAPVDVVWESDPFDPVYFPGWNDVVIPDVYTIGNFYVGYVPVTPDPATDYFYAGISKGDPEEINGGALIWYWPWYSEYGAPNQWAAANLFTSANSNLTMEVRFCSIPVPERLCGDDDWVTMQHDFQRSGASGTDLGDAQCFLTHEWDTTDTFGNAQWIGPIIYNGMLVTTFKNASGAQYTVRDLETKAMIYQFTYNGEVRGMPTASYVDALGTDVLFVTGGTDMDVVQAIDLATGNAIWTISSNAGAPDNMPTGMTNGEINQFSNFIVLNDGTDDVLYFTTTTGKVYAVNAATGADYWGNYYQYPGFGAVNNRTGATDGVDKLFYGYQTVAGGDLVCLDAFTGTLNWQLSDDGFHGNDAFGGGVTSESFQAGVAVDVYPDEQKLYAISTVTGAAPREAVLYQIDYNAGVTTAYTPTNGVGFYITPVIDKNRVYVPSFSALTEPANSAVVQAYGKKTLDMDWGIYWGENIYSDVFNADMLLTCEPEGAADLLFGMDYYGYLRCIDADEGVELFHRRVNYGPGNDVRGGNGAIGNDLSGNTHLVWQSIFGTVDLVMGTTERARLQILNYANRAPVPFGSDPNYEVTFTDVFANTGCADLTADVAISDVSNGVGEPPLLTVPDGLNNRAQSMANTLSNASTYHKVLRSHTFSEAISSDVYQPSADKDLVNPAALADMSWINTPLLNTITGPGGVSNLSVFVNQGMVGRGVFHFYAAFTNMNDNDYWLSQVEDVPAPEVRLDFIGGCLLETTTLHFGDGGANTQACWNNGRLATITDADTVIGFHIDGVNGVLFAGNYVMGVSERRLALSNKSWLEGATESDAWVSWLPDLYNGECVPELSADVQLGSWSDDGLTYHPIYGNAVEANSIDSVQNFFDPADSTWKWDWYVAPYDNDSTMGLAIHHRHIGAYDYGQGTSNILQYIGNATVEIMNVTERNGRDVPGWYIGSYLDYDFRPTSSGVDTTLWDPNISLAWGFCKSVTGARPVGGMMTLPFNFCNNPADPFYQEGMLNAMAIDQRQGMWGPGAGSIPYLDSAYYYMTRAKGLYSHNPLPPSEDMASSFTYTHHDFAPNETYTFATGYFEFQDYPTATTSAGIMTKMAYQLNKWMGYGRGDVNNDNKIDLSDIVYLANYVNYGGPGPIPFMYLGNLNGASTGAGIDMTDVMYLVNYYFNEGPCPEGILKNTGKATDAADY